MCTSTRLLSDQSWSMHARLGTRASQKIKQSRSKIQRHAVQVIVGNIPYEEACCMLNLSPLSDRRRSLCSALFKQTVSRESHVLHYLLPAKQDAEVTSRLRSMNKYPTVRAQTNRYHKKLSYRREAARCLVLFSILVSR